MCAATGGGGTSQSNILREIYNQDSTEYERLSSLNLSKSTSAAFKIDAPSVSKRMFSRMPKRPTGSDAEGKQGSSTSICSIKTLPTSNTTVTPLDCHFMAENCIIRIIPNFTSPGDLELISASLPRFRAAHACEVPLWVALSLKRQRKCNIQKPIWMDPEDLEERKTKEQESPIFIEPPHPHYRELTEIILNNAIDDIDNADAIRTAVKDLWDTRASKLFTTCQDFLDQPEMEADDNTGEVVKTGRSKEDQDMFASLNNVTQLELTLVRDSFLEALDVKRALLVQKFNTED